MGKNDDCPDDVDECIEVESDKKSSGGGTSLSDFWSDDDAVDDVLADADLPDVRREPPRDDLPDPSDLPEPPEPEVDECTSLKQSLSSL